MTTAHTIAIRKTVISMAALALLSAPLMVSAGTIQASAPNAAPLKTERVNVVSSDPETVYHELKTNSHKVCGSSDLRITGGLMFSRKVEECYEGTLTAAVHRLDNPAVTELHFE